MVGLMSCWIVCNYFSSFETGIANEINSLEWRKILICIKNNLQNSTILSTDHHKLLISVKFNLLWNKLEKV